MEVWNELRRFDENKAMKKDFDNFGKKNKKTFVFLTLFRAWGLGFQVNNNGIQALIIFISFGYVSKNGSIWYKTKPKL